jgi:UDP-sugar transporter A1/2/3
MASSSPGPARWRGGKPALPGHPSQLVATSEPLLNGGGVVWQAAAAPNGAEHQFAPANNGGSWGTSGAPAAGSIEHAADKQWSVAGDGAGGQPYFAPVQRRSAGATYVDGQLQPPLYGDGSTLGQPVQQYSEAQYVPASLGGQAVHRQLAAIAGHQAGTGYGDAAAQYSSGDEEKGSARLAAARRPVTPVTPATLRRNSRLAMLSMLLLVFQGTALSIMLRYSRARAGTPYLASVSVILTEVIKLLICLVMQFKVVAGEVAAGTAGKPSPPPGGSSSSMGSAHSSGGSATSLFGGAGQAGSQGALAREVRRQARDIATKSLPMLLPAGMFVMQQVLLVIAATHLDAVAFQIFSQSFKLVPTALFAYWLLGQMLEPMQWASIPVLAFGVILVTVNNGGGSAKSAAAAAVSSSSHGLDYVAGMVACSISGLSSAYAGVYFEKYVKGKHAASLWVRNIQLGIYGVPLSTLYALVKDGRRIYTGGLLQGFDSATWMVIALQVFGGLVTGMVVKYCDNILKNFALAISVILTVLVAIPLFGQACCCFDRGCSCLLVLISRSPSRFWWPSRSLARCDVQLVAVTADAVVGCWVLLVRRCML